MSTVAYILILNRLYLRLHLKHVKVILTFWTSKNEVSLADWDVHFPMTDWKDASFMNLKNLLSYRKSQEEWECLLILTDDSIFQSILKVKIEKQKGILICSGLYCWNLGVALLSIRNNGSFFFSFSFSSFFFSSFLLLSIFYMISFVCNL